MRRADKDGLVKTTVELEIIKLRAELKEISRLFKPRLSSLIAVAAADTQPAAST